MTSSKSVEAAGLLFKNGCPVRGELPWTGLQVLLLLVKATSIKLRARDQISESDQFVISVKLHTR